MEMPDSGIKKVVIQKSSLPEISGANQNYSLRFRIVSEDKNRSSHWSTKYRLSVPSVTGIDYRVAVDQSHDMVTAVWVPEAGTKSEFDVYIKWDNEAWQFVSTVFTTTYSTIIKTGANHVQIAVQVPTFPKERFAGTTLFESTQQNV
jgi:hypothetical protein